MDFFEPNLSMSCGAMGAILTAANRPSDAADSFLRGILTLSRLFAIMPLAFKQLMMNLLKGYDAACKKAEIEPDVKKMMPVMEVFQRLQEKNSDPEEKR